MLIDTLAREIDVVKDAVKLIRFRVPGAKELAPKRPASVSFVPSTY